MSKLTGGQIAGGNTVSARAKHDYYATDPKAVNMLLKKYNFCKANILEPCVGAGHIAETLTDYYNNYPNITAIDIVDRGYPNTIVQDFLTWETNEKFEGIITNPPYSLAMEFAEKGIELLEEDGVMALFLKLQFLEGSKRKSFFEKYPPKYIYVFRNRMATWKNGSSVNPETNKKWAETICFAWFIWEKGFKGEPVIRWLD